MSMVTLRLFSSRCAPAAVILATLLSSGAARADITADQRAAAQALFDDARKLIADKKWVEACPKLEESQRLDPGLGTLLNLAECQSQIGKTASAWANFLEAAYQAKATNQAKREATARAHATALEPKLSRITILAVGAAAAGLEIRRDGVVVAASVVGTAVPVDPGEHTVSASAPGKRAWSTKVVVRADGHMASVSVPQLEDVGPGSPPGPEPPPGTPKPPPGTPRANPPPQGPGAPPEPPSQPPEADDAGPRGQRIGGIALVVVGAGGLAIGAAFTALASKKLNDSNAQGCNKTTNVCSNPTAFGLRNDARTFGNVATGGWVAGGLVAAGGVALLVTSVLMKPRPESPASGTSSLVPNFSIFSIDGRGGATIGTSGRF
jgi:hypothetical protein